MKIFGKSFVVVLAIAVVAMSAVAGCGGGGGGGTPSTAVSLNTISGRTDIPVNSTFTYTFNQMVNPGTVSATTFFIAPAPAAAAQVAKDAYDDTVCNVASAIPAAVSCTTPTECQLDPISDLAANTQYAACLTTAIQYNLGTAFEGFSALFTTAGGASPTFTSKLVKLDSSEIEFTAAPIPRAVKVKYIPTTAITDATAQQAFEAAVALKDGAGTAVAGAYAWAADGSSVLFTPTARLGYRTTYTVYADGTAVTGGSFTTLTKDDINGDGYADLLVGAYTNRNTNPPGKLYIFYGTATGIQTCNISGSACYGAVLGGDANDLMGLSNDIVGDVNADGYEDFIVGAPQSGLTGTRKGTAYVFAGGTALTGTLAKTQALATISMAAVAIENLGYSVAGAGDMNKDGYDDVLVGAPWANGNTGQAFVFLGGTTLPGTHDASTASQVITGQVTNYLGAMVDGIGDVNGDGFDDIILSSNSGNAYVLYGAPTLATARDAVAADAVITGTPPFGKSVAGVGDVNGDGTPDAMVGRPTAGMGTSGYVYVFLGGQLAGTVASGAAFSTISAPFANDDLFAGTLTGAGDIDGDGTSDLLIGGQTASLAADWGLAYIFLGKNLQAAMTDVQADTLIHGATGADLLSYGLSGAVDFNNDGFDDIVVGAPQYWTPGTGFAYVFSGSAAGMTSCTFAAPSTCSPAATITGALQDALGYMGTTVYAYP